jgi:hypothetical protein
MLSRDTKPWPTGKLRLLDGTATGNPLASNLEIDAGVQAATLRISGTGQKIKLDRRRARLLQQRQTRRPIGALAARAGNTDRVAIAQLRFAIEARDSGASAASRLGSDP